MKWRYPAALGLLALIGYALIHWLSPAPRIMTPLAAEELAEILNTDIPALETAGATPFHYMLEDIKPLDIPAQEAAGAAAPVLLDALRNVLQDFDKKQDVRYTAPDSSISPLHAACLFKKKELVRCLLQHGADPNLHSEEDDSPLLLALSTYLTPETETQSLITLADTLLAAGADFAKSGHAPGDFLTQAALVCENEQVILYLLEQKGARPEASTAAPLALHGWSSALKRVLETQPGTRGLLHTAALGSASFSGDFEGCIRLLLDHGAEINGDEDEGLHGVTPLFRLAEALSDMPAEAPHRAQAMQTLQYLLRQGADPYLRADGDETHPGFCPYDLLALRPGLVAELAPYGLPQQPPTMRLSSGAPLLADVCRLAAMPPAEQQLAEQADKIATVLTPSAEMLQSELYPQALEAAVALLARLDTARAASALLASPLWQMPRAAAAPAHDALLEALRNRPALILPKEFICSTAEKWVSSGSADEAAALLELLARCPDARAEIERYCQDELLPLQAGAYAALLSTRGLPDARDGGVQDWLRAHNREADTDFLRQALLLTSLERLWYGDMTAEEQAQLLGLMRRVGAPAAAAAYEQICRHLDDPDALDTIVNQGTDWKFELEIATARFFLEHAAEFAPHAKS